MLGVLRLPVTLKKVGWRTVSGLMRDTRIYFPQGVLYVNRRMEFDPFNNQHSKLVVSKDVVELEHNELFV